MIIITSYGKRNISMTNKPLVAYYVLYICCFTAVLSSYV